MFAPETVPTSARTLGALCTVLALVSGTGRAAGTPQPIRRLVYSFSVTIATDLDVQSGNETGFTRYNGSTGDEGTIEIDVTQVAQDGGLVVRVSENARNTRTAKAAACAVYPNGDSVCQAGAKVNDEELALLKIVGRGLVDPQKLDAKKHWSYSWSGGPFSERSDYTIVAGEPSGMMQIALTRVDTMTGAQPFSSTTDGKITYNGPLEVPTSLRQQTIERMQEGLGKYRSVRTDIGADLLSDSMNPAR